MCVSSSTSADRGNAGDSTPRCRRDTQPIEPCAPLNGCRARSPAQLGNCPEKTNGVGHSHDSSHSKNMDRMAPSGTNHINHCTSIVANRRREASLFFIAPPEGGGQQSLRSVKRRTNGACRPPASVKPGPDNLLPRGFLPVCCATAADFSRPLPAAPANRLEEPASAGGRVLQPLHVYTLAENCQKSFSKESASGVFTFSEPATAQRDATREKNSPSARGGTRTALPRGCSLPNRENPSPAACRPEGRQSPS